LKWFLPECSALLRSGPLEFTIGALRQVDIGIQGGFTTVCPFTGSAALLPLLPAGRFDPAIPLH
jgi:hypothetical protein